ncbi:MAG: nucleotide exchange factor GrpE [Flavobacteriales bacterium]|nr:nucleotide exchange factor GrpE [Flavobacteriales bacterium]
MENKHTEQMHEEELQPVNHETPEVSESSIETPEKTNETSENTNETAENTNETVENKNIEDNNSNPDWESKYKETYDQYLRLFSEFDNFRKRNAKERIELIKTAGSEILTVILPVLDDFDRALKTMDSNASDINALKTGVEMIFQKLLHVLQEKGLQAYNPIGEKFDPEIHEAITHIPAQEEGQKGTIIDVIEKGYKMHDKVLRYPKVVVAQ